MSAVEAVVTIALALAWPTVAVVSVVVIGREARRSGR